jgi:NADPH-dependent F420 reductase
MEKEQNIDKISIVGGTGALGSGLARRWAQAGYEIIIGSRNDAKAIEAAEALRSDLPNASISGLENLAAAEAGDIVILTVPFAHQKPTLERIKPALAGKILVDTTVPLVPPKVARVSLPEEGSAAVRAQQIVGPDVDVVSAFQNVAAELMASDRELACDVLVAGDKLASRQLVVDLARKANFHAWHAGALVNSAAMEALTSVLIFMNKRYNCDHAGIRITGIDDH